MSEQIFPCETEMLVWDCQNKIKAKECVKFKTIKYSAVNLLASTISPEPGVQTKESKPMKIIVIFFPSQKNDNFN